MTILRDQWATNRDAVLVISGCWLVLATGQAVMAVAVVQLVTAADHGLAGTLGWAALGGLAAAAVAQALFLAYMLRIELSDRAGHILSCRLMSAVGEETGTGHLEDSSSLDTIRIASDSWALVGLFAGGIQLTAVSVGLIATMPVIGAGSWFGLLTIPLCLPLLLASARSHRIRTATTKAAAADLRSAELLYSTLADPDAQTELRVTGAHATLVARYRMLFLRSTYIQQKGNMHAATGILAAWIVFLLGFAGLLYAIIVVAHSPSVGIVAIVTVALQLQGVAVATVNGTADVARGTNVGEAYTQVTAGHERFVYEDGGVPGTLTNGISLAGVSFSYPGTDKLVLRDVTVHLPAGSVVAVVGAHGSGKSTLVKLLTRMYEPTSGSITVDGRPIDSLAADAWRERLTACFQEFARPQTRLGTSIAMGDLERATAARVSYAAERAGADAIVDELPNGFETQLGDLGVGVGLSGGQWQRLAVARAFMRQSPLLVALDEPSASFDPTAELKVFHSTIAHVRHLGRACGTITLLVAHRYSTVQDADLILVLHQGRLVEHGTHDQLMLQNQRYAEMYLLQRAAHALNGPSPLRPTGQKEHT